MKKIRIAYLQKAPSGHSNACLRALAESGRAELFVTMPPNEPNTPYDRNLFGWLDTAYHLESLDRDTGLLAAVREFRPHVALVVGWETRAYRNCVRHLRGTSLRVVCMDNQWLRTPKQVLGIATAKLYLRPYFDAAFLPGARQMDFALRLGFTRDRIFEGFYSADVDAYRTVPSLGGTSDGRRSFVFVGRLLPQKGIRELMQAYTAYRAAVSDPWNLLVIGTGPLATAVDGVPGVELTGFVEPTEMPAQLARASFLVLPSTFEPWGVAVHEATAAGLGCICTSAVGAGDALVGDGSNGRIIRPASASDLVAAMKWAHARSTVELAEVSRVSRSLASRFSPTRWADTVLSMAQTRELGQ